MSAELRLAAQAVLEEWDSPGRSWGSLLAPISALRRAYRAVPVHRELWAVYLRDHADALDPGGAR